MSNLIKISEIPGLTQAETIALEAFSRPKIKELRKSDMVVVIVNSISKARIIKGQIGTKQDDTVMSDIIITELKESCPTFSLEEISIAIEMGAMGKLNVEAVHICPENIFKWIWKYRDQIRQEAIHKKRKHEENQEKQVNEAKRLEGIRNFEASIIELYNNFSGELDQSDTVVHAAMYRHIVSKNGQELEPEEHIRLWGEASEILKIGNEEKSFDQKIKERIEKNYHIAILESNQKTIAEALALKEVFINWKIDKKNLTF